jgi:carbonic anhydrase/acetyltransferase-like protein (isoleucine patch superfamily)
MPLFSARGFSPQIHEKSFVAPTASIVGDVTLGSGSSVWFGCVLRGDVMPIVVGEDSNIQDNSVLHGTFQKFGTRVGRRVTVGHGVILHGCEIEEESLVGMGSILMDGSVLGRQCIVGAGSLVTEGSRFEPQSLIFGRPAKFIRKLSDREIAFLSQSAENYKIYQTWYDQV